MSDCVYAGETVIELERETKNIRRLRERECEGKIVKNRTIRVFGTQSTGTKGEYRWRTLVRFAF